MKRHITRESIPLLIEMSKRKEPISGRVCHFISSHPINHCPYPYHCKTALPVTDHLHCIAFKASSDKDAEKLGTMNNGQGHRARLTAELAASGDYSRFRGPKGFPK